VGAAVDTAPADDPLTFLFGEGPGGFVLSGGREQLESLASVDLEVLVCGEVGGERLRIAVSAAEIDLPLARLRGMHDEGLASLMA
jgi:hypothetical protein